jgi:hypothetical protein
VSQIENLVAGDLLGGSLEGNRDVYICVFELIGNLAFGEAFLNPPLIVQIPGYI